MSSIEKGGPGELPPVDVKCTGDVFENAIRAFGVVNACEWFGHECASEFTAETVRTLMERGAA